MRCPSSGVRLAVLSTLLAAGIDEISCLPGGGMILVLTSLRKRWEKQARSDDLGLDTESVKLPTAIHALKTNIQLQIILVWLALLLFPIYDELAY